MKRRRVRRHAQVTGQRFQWTAGDRLDSSVWTCPRMSERALRRSRPLPDRCGNPPHRVVEGQPE